MFHPAVRKKSLGMVAVKLRKRREMPKKVIFLYKNAYTHHGNSWIWDEEDIKLTFVS